MDKNYLLTSAQMAEFVARGFLRFDALVPSEINRAVMAEIDAGRIRGAPAGTPLSECYQGSSIRTILDMPEYRGHHPQPGRRRSPVRPRRRSRARTE